MSSRFFKISVCFERREDGGLRAYSNDVPGLVLSSLDVNGVIADVPVALGFILSRRLNAPIEVEPLPNIRDTLEDNGIVSRERFIPQSREYVAIRQ